MVENLLYSIHGKFYSLVCGNVLDKLLKMSYSLVGRNIPSQQCGKDISINVS